MENSFNSKEHAFRVLKRNDMIISRDGKNYLAKNKYAPIRQNKNSIEYDAIQYLHRKDIFVNEYPDGWEMSM